MKTGRVLTYSLLAAAFVLLHAPLYNWWCWTWIGRLLGGITSSYLNDGVALLLCAISVVIGLWLPKSLSEEGNKWGRILSGCLLFILLVQSFAFNDRFVHSKAIPWIRYSDILLPFLIAFIVVSLRNYCKNSSKEQEKQSERLTKLYCDDVSEIDFLGRKQLVQHLCDKLTSSEPNKNGALGVAITGGWGTGKSWIMSQLSDLLKAKGGICIDFKPWLYGETDIPRLFYQKLDTELKSSNVEVEDLKKAVAEIEGDELSGFGRAFLSIFGIVTKRGGREQTVRNIKDELVKANRQIYIFIDDCDRLAHHELLQVLSLVRNSGDFPYLTYVMAFDKKIVENVIGEEFGLGYVGKMFNLTIDLPPISDSILSDYLQQASCDILGINVDKENNPFRRVPITRYLPTVREAKKYLNLLSSDYTRLKERFKRYYYSEGDFCLIELLKYKYPYAYFALQSNPTLNLSFELKGWNSPVGVLSNKTFDIEEADDISALFNSLFSIKQYPYYRDEIYGISNKVFFPLYFEQDLPYKYVEREAFDEAINSGSIIEKIDEWMSEDNRGVFELLVANHSDLTRRNVFLAMAKYIRNLCEKKEGTGSFDDMIYGYESRDLKTGFNSIMDVIKEHPQIDLLTFQHITEEDMNVASDGVKDLIEEGNYNMELMGIWLSQLKTVSNTDYPYGEINYYVGLLWANLVKQLNGNKVSTMDLLDVLSHCTFQDSFTKMALPLITENPRRWLGATVLTLKSGREEYYLLKSRTIHAIFGDLESMYREIEDLVNAAKPEDLEYVKAYQSLILGIAAMIVNNEDPFINNKYKEPDSIKVEAYPAISESVFVGTAAVMPISAALEQIKNTPFWKGENLRIHRDAPDYYFGTEI